MPAHPLRIVLTGATGFVGANLVRYFVERGHEVIALTGRTRSSWRLDDLQSPRLTLQSVDLESASAIHAFLDSQRPEVLINCAAYGSYSSQTDAARIYRVNFEAVRTMLDGVTRIPGFKAFIQLGSQSEYGLNCTAPTEDQATLPDSEYAVSKVAATALTQFYGKKKNIPAWSFRLYSVYGPYEDPSRLILKLLDHARRGKLPPLANPRISRDFIHTDDVSRAVEQLIERAETTPKGEVYNIASGTCTTLEGLVQATQKAFDLRTPPDWGSMPDRKWDHADWYGNPAKAERDFGWKARVTLPDGLRQTMEWIQAHPAAMSAALQQSVLPQA